MSRFIKITILTLSVCLLCNSASARQSGSQPAFPNTLSKAIDRAALARQSEAAKTPIRRPAKVSVARTNSIQATSQRPKFSIMKRDRSESNQTAQAKAAAIPAQPVAARVDQPDNKQLPTAPVAQLPTTPTPSRQNPSRNSDLDPSNQFMAKDSFSGGYVAPTNSLAGQSVASPQAASPPGLSTQDFSPVPNFSNYVINDHTVQESAVPLTNPVDSPTLVDSQPHDFATSRDDNSFEPATQAPVVREAVTEETAAEDFGTVMMFPAVEPQRQGSAPPRHPEMSMIVAPDKALNIETDPAANGFSARQNVSSIPTLSNSPQSTASPTTAPTYHFASWPNPVEPKRTKSTVPIRAANQIIQTSVVGPEWLITNAADEFEIIVQNPSSRNATAIVVQMVVAEDLTITDLDRAAWLDNETRTVSWKLDRLDAGYQEVIRFRAQSNTPGRHRQTLSVGMEDTFQSQSSFEAVVVNEQQLEHSSQPVLKK